MNVAAKWRRLANDVQTHFCVSMVRAIIIIFIIIFIRTQGTIINWKQIITLK